MLYANRVVKMEKNCESEKVVFCCLRICYSKSSSAAELATLSDRLGPHGSVQVSHGSLQLMMTCYSQNLHRPICGPNRSDKAASSAADDDLL